MQNVTKFSFIIFGTIYHLPGSDLLSFSNFSEVLLMDSLDILSLETSSKNYIKWYNLSIIKRAAIFKEDHMADSVSEGLGQAL